MEKPTAETSESAPITLPLNQAQVALLQQFPESDQKYAEYAIRREAAQAFERASYEWQQPRLQKPDRPLYAAQPRDSETLGSISRMYQSQASTASPMERFTTMSALDEPVPVIAKAGLEAAGLEFGSLESLDTRSAAAKLLAISIDESAESNQEPELTHADFVRIARQEHSGQNILKARTMRPPRLSRKRRREFGTPSVDQTNREKRKKT